MTNDEFLHTLRQANSAVNVGQFRERLRSALSDMPDHYFQNPEILAELRKAKRRARREGLFERYIDPLCECGHEGEWHENGLYCNRCPDCAIFRPAGDGPASQHHTITQHNLHLPLAIRVMGLTPEDREAVVRADTTERARRKSQQTPSANPWEQLIEERKDKRTRLCRTVQDAPPEEVDEAYIRGMVWTIPVRRPRRGE